MNLNYVNKIIKKQTIYHHNRNLVLVFQIDVVTNILFALCDSFEIVVLGFHRLSLRKTEQILQLEVFFHPSNIVKKWIYGNAGITLSPKNLFIREQFSSNLKPSCSSLSLKVLITSDLEIIPLLLVSKTLKKN